MKCEGYGEKLDEKLTLLRDQLKFHNLQSQIQNLHK